MSGKKDTAAFLRELTEQGFRVLPTRRNSHVVIKAPDGIGLHATGLIPSDWRGIKNLRAWARRHGFEDRRN